MKFFSHSGLYPFEREVGQPIEIDVTCSLNLDRAGRSDRIDDTLNYVEIYRKVASVVEKRSHNLIEALAEEIAGSILECEQVMAVVVHCRKPKVRLPGMLDYVEVAVERSR